MEKRLNSNYNNPIIRKMRTIAFLYTGTLSPYQFEKTFDGKSAVERAVLWSQNLDSVQKAYILTVPQNESAVKDAVSAVNAQNIAVETKDFWTNAALVKSLAEKTASEKADAAVLAWGSCPFLDRELSLKVLSDHEKYLAEYTYSDGFPYGFAPEVIDAGKIRLFYVAGFLFLNGILDVISNFMRAIGYSSIPAVLMLVGIIGVRVLWLLIVFPIYRTLSMVYICFPISWFVTCVIDGIAMAYFYKKVKE